MYKFIPNMPYTNTIGHMNPHKVNSCILTIKTTVVNIVNAVENRLNHVFKKNFKNFIS